MLNILWVYLFIGTIVGLLLETMVRMSYNSVNMYERFWLITLWPIMLLIFLYYFFKHLFFNIDDE
jgi:uncharacterized protein YacL